MRYNDMYASLVFSKDLYYGVWYIYDARMHASSCRIVIAILNPPSAVKKEG